MTRKDFVEWQSYPVTKLLYSAINQRINDLKDELSYSAGSDPHADSKKAGAIQALRDVLDTDWFEETNND